MTALEALQYRYETENETGFTAPRPIHRVHTSLAVPDHTTRRIAMIAADQSPWRFDRGTTAQPFTVTQATDKAIDITAILRGNALNTDFLAKNCLSQVNEPLSIEHVLREIAKRHACYIHTAIDRSAPVPHPIYTEDQATLRVWSRRVEEKLATLENRLNAQATLATEIAELDSAYDILARDVDRLKAPPPLTVSPGPRPRRITNKPFWLRYSIRLGMVLAAVRHPERY